jgi:hypothetical protein
LQAARDAAPVAAGKIPPLPRKGVLPEFAGKTYLAALGIPVPAGGLAADFAAAKPIASQIGYPVALKAQARSLTHKSDIGGVILGIDDERALAASERMARHGVRWHRARGHFGRGHGPDRPRDTVGQGVRTGVRFSWSGSAASGWRRLMTCG